MTTMCALSRFVNRSLSAGLALSLVVLCQPATADLDIEITEGVDRKVPIAIFPFAGELDKKRNFSDTLSANLARSGVFAIMPVPPDRPRRKEQVSEQQYVGWLERGIEKVVIGRVITRGNKADIHFDLLDTVQRKRILGYSIEIDREAPWQAAHLAGDYIFRELTGMPGVFNTRLAFVTSTRVKGKKRHFILHVSDADGYNVKQIFSTPFQIMSPTWAPDGTRIAYISYESGRPELFIQNLATAERKSYAKYTGVASSPKWSADGRYIAYSGPRKGNYDIYVFDLETGKTRRLTRHRSIDTEPAWGENGELFFTSDRRGTPQIYRVNKDGSVSLVTQSGEHNSGADVAPHGGSLVFLSARGGHFSIVVRDLKSNSEAELPGSITDEGPSISPNGQMVAYLAKHQGRTTIGIYTSDGMHRSILPIDEGNIRAVAWSPLIR